MSFLEKAQKLATLLTEDEAEHLLEALRNDLRFIKDHNFDEDVIKRGQELNQLFEKVLDIFEKN